MLESDGLYFFSKVKSQRLSYIVSLLIFIAHLLPLSFYADHLVSHHAHFHEHIANHSHENGGTIPGDHDHSNPAMPCDTCELLTAQIGQNLFLNVVSQSVECCWFSVRSLTFLKYFHSQKHHNEALPRAPPCFS